MRYALRIGLLLWLGAVALAMAPNLFDGLDPIKWLIMVWAAVPLALLTAADAWTRDPSSPRRGARIWSLVALALWISWLMAPIHGNGAAHRIGVVELAALATAAFASARVASDERDAVWLLRGLVVVGGLQAGVVLLQATGFDPLMILSPRDRLWRVSGTVGNPNIAAALMIPAGVVALGPAIVRARALRVGLSTAMIGAVVATGSRFGAVLFAVGLIAATFATAQSRRRRAVIAALALAAAGATFGLAAMTGKDFSSIGGRFAFWRISAHAIADAPLLGHGRSHFAGVYASTALHLGHDADVPLALPDHAHNDWLELAVELGLVQAMLITIAVAGAVALAWRRGGVARLASLALGVAALNASWNATLYNPATAAAFAHLFGVTVGLAGRGNTSDSRGGLSLTALLMGACAASGVFAEAERIRGHAVAMSASGAHARNDVAEAVELWRRAVELAPSEGAFRYRLAQAFALQGDWTAALENARAARETHAAFDLFMLESVMLWQTGSANEAVAHASALTATFPRHWRARTLLIEMRSSARDRYR